MSDSVVTIDDKKVSASQVHIPSTWYQCITGIEKKEDIALFSTFGRGRSFRVILEQWRIIRRIESDIARLNSEIQSKLQQLDIENGKLDQLNAQIENITNEINSLRSGITQSEDTIVNGRLRVHQLKDSEIPESKRRVVLQGDRIANLVAQKELLETQLSALNVQLNDTTEERNNVNVEIQTLKSEIITRSDQMSTNADILSIKSQIENKTSEIHDQSQRISATVIEIDEARKEYQRLRDIWIQASTDNSPDEPVAKSNMESQKKILDDKENVLEAQRVHLATLQSDLLVLQNNLIDKIVELDPVLQSKKDRLQLVTNQLETLETTITGINNQIETTTSGISASNENIVNGNIELERLKQVVVEKEAEYDRTILEIQQAQVVIVSNSNAIPIRESEKDELLEEKEKQVVIIANIEHEHDELREQVRVLQESRDERESKINTVSMIDYYPYEFLPVDSEFKSLEEYHDENITDEELLEIKGILYTQKIVHDSIPSIIEYVYPDGNLFGIYHGSVKELTNADIDYVYPSESGVIKPVVARSTGNGIERSFIKEKLVYNDSTVYRQPVYVSKLISEPGIYHWVACLYGSHVLCLSGVSRDDDYNTNKLIINETHSLEINYAFNFFYKPFTDQIYSYNIQVDDIEYNVSCRFLLENLQDFYSREANTLYKFMYTPIKPYSMTLTDGNTLQISDRDYKNYLSTERPNIVHVTHNYRRSERWELGRQQISVKKALISGMYIKFNEIKTIDEFIEITFTPDLRLDHKRLSIPVPTAFDISQIQFLHFEQYLGRESDFIKLNKESIVNSIDILSGTTLSDITDPTELGFSYINNIKS